MPLDNVPESPSTTLKAATLAQRGFRVFELLPNEKRPRPVQTIDPATGKRVWSAKGWLQRATSDVLEILGTWRNDSNIGIATGGDLFVLDVDTKGGKDGMASLAALGIPTDTFTVRTPSGGLHLYFDPQGEEFASAVEQLGPGLDVRSWHGLAVAPGSSIDGREYTILHDRPIAPLPAKLRELCRARPTKVADRHAHDAATDDPAATAAAVAFLTSPQTPVAVEGAGGDNTTIRVANRVMDFGIGPDTCAELMLEHWNDRCAPPWDYDDLHRKVASAANSRQEPIGRDNPGLGFDVIDDPSDKILLSAERWIGTKPEPPRFVIEALVPEGFVTLLAAKGGTGKSTLALQMMVCVAAGIPFLGFPVVQGVAAGVFCEDPDSVIHLRLLAICGQLGIEFDSVAPRLRPVSMLQGESTSLWTEKSQPTRLWERLRRELASIPDLKLAVIDGAADTFAGQEWERRQVSGYLASLTQAASAGGYATILTAHESKRLPGDQSDQNAVSGSTAWVNKSRSTISMSSDGQGLRTIKQLKGNYGPFLPPFSCNLDGAFVRLDGDAKRQEDCRRYVDDALTTMIKAGKKLSPMPKANNYAARALFEGQSGQARYSELEIVAALDALKGNRFAIEQYASGGKLAKRWALISESAEAVMPATVRLADASGSDSSGRST